MLSWAWDQPQFIPSPGESPIWSQAGLLLEPQGCLVSRFPPGSHLHHGRAGAVCLNHQGFLLNGHCRAVIRHLLSLPALPPTTVCLCGPHFGCPTPLAVGPDPKSAATAPAATPPGVPHSQMALFSLDGFRRRDLISAALLCQDHMGLQARRAEGQACSCCQHPHP